MQKLIELWNAIPREKEWWLDQLAMMMNGCAIGCGTIFVCYALSLAVSISASFGFAKNTMEALTMGFAWGSTLGLLVTLVLGSALLSVIAWLRGA